MKTWQKVAIGVGAVVALGSIVAVSVNQANKGVVTVQTAKVATQESLVSQVTASGEVKPTTYTNVTAQGFGRIIEILVKEGDHVKKGDRLLLQEQLVTLLDVVPFLDKDAGDSSESLGGHIGISRRLDFAGSCHH